MFCSQIDKCILYIGKQHNDRVIFLSKFNDTGYYSETKNTESFDATFDDTIF